MLLGFQKRSEGVGAAACLEEHGGVDPVQCRGLQARSQSLIANIRRALLAATSPTLDFGLDTGISEQRKLYLAGWGPLDPVSHG